MNLDALSAMHVSSSIVILLTGRTGVRAVYRICSAFARRLRSLRLSNVSEGRASGHEAYLCDIRDVIKVACCVEDAQNMRRLRAALL